jgi:peptidoglycan/xylan/chitin deacetylase (PgdA/CDA1 family)
MRFIGKKRTGEVILFLIIIALLFIYIDFSSTNLYKKEDKRGRIYWHGPIDKKNIALTFDDGPSECTPVILDILRNYSINATFFVIGMNAERLPAIIKREVSEGHAIGGHSFSHPDMQIEMPEKIREQLDKTEQAARNVANLSLYLFRPPYGFNNRFVLKESMRRGYITIEWSVSGKDWKSKNSGKVAENVISKTQNGTIILLHDGRRLSKNPDCNSTIDALPRIIENLAFAGYHFVTVPELLAINVSG